ncbi:MAG: hypothetical protein ABI557_20915, partial [Aureliella sp.]
MNALETTLLVLGILVGNSLIWMFVLRMLSRLGGWKKLAQRFPATGNETGKTFRFQTGYIGWVRYKGVLTLVINPNGLGLSAVFPFRIGHPAVFIPWDEFHNFQEVKKFMHTVVVMDAGDPVML